MLPEKHDVAGPENWVHGTRYQASDPTALYDMLTGLDIDHAEYSFIDLGSGKGRAVLVAARLPFKKVIGVEYSTKLHEIGRRNLDRVPRSEQACGAIELAHADAATIEIPAGPLVIFLYNPFGEPVMRRVVDNVDRSLRNAERPVVVLYVNPRFAEPWLDAGFTADPRSTEWMAVLVRYVSPRARRSERASSRGDRARRRSDRRVGGKAGLKAGA
jgi:SAM-dependent methyltransferase